MSAPTKEKDKLHTDLLLAAILLNRFEPLEPHHVGAIRERLNYLSDDELRTMILKGKYPKQN